MGLSDPPREAGPVGAAQLADLPVWRADRLLQGAVRGRRYVHNPAVDDGLLLLSRGAAAVLDGADGQPLGALVAAIPAPADALPGLWHDAGRLLRLGMLRHPRAETLRVAQALAIAPSAPKERVFDLWLHVTNDCNLDCPYCYIHKSPVHMDQDAMERTLGAIEAAARAGHTDRVHVRYAGGEPMLRLAALQRFHEAAIARCAAHGVRYSAAILTNGTVVPRGATAWVRDAGIGVSVSIDGLGAGQDAMRPTRNGRGSWSHLERGLDAWQGAGIRPYGLVTLGEHNVEQAPELVSWLLARGLGFRLSLVRDLEWGAGALDDRHGASRRHERAPLGRDTILEGEALYAVVRPLMAAYDRIEAHVAASLDAGATPSPPLRATHRFCDLSPLRPIRKACGAGSSYAAVSQTGQLSPCQAALHHEAETSLLDGQRSIVEVARAHQPFGAFSRDTGNPTCQTCRHQASCAGGCPLLLHRRDGHIDGRSPYCEVFRAVIPRMVRIFALELMAEQLRAQAQAQSRATGATATAVASQPTSGVSVGFATEFERVG